MESVEYNSRWLTPTRFLVLSFLLMISIGTVMLMLPVSASSGGATRFIDALFTSTSAVCVTGLTVFIKQEPHWSVFWAGCNNVADSGGRLGHNDVFNCPRPCNWTPHYIERAGFHSGTNGLLGPFRIGFPYEKRHSLQ